METTKKYYRVNRSKINYLRFTLEAYEGVAMVTTVDPRAGIIVLRVAPGCLAEAEMIMGDLKRDLLIEELEELEINSF